MWAELRVAHKLRSKRWFVGKAAVKRKFGDSVRSKTDVAMKNEVLCKLVCHNTSCVIHEMHESGIDPAYWVEQAQAV